MTTSQQISPAKPKLDDKDLQIINMLRKDGRISSSDIAKKIGLSKTAIKYRLDRLTKEKVIHGFFALVDSEVLGNKLSVNFDLIVEPRSIEKVAQQLEDFDEIVRIYELTNSPELHVHALFRDQSQMERFMKEKLYVIQGVTSIRTGIIIKRYKSDVSVTI